MGGVGSEMPSTGKKWKMTPVWIQPVTATLSPTSAPGEGITGMASGNMVKQLQDELCGM